MELQIVPSKKAAPVKHSLVLAFAGIPQRGPLSPNGRIFRRLAGPITNFTISKDGHIDQELTWEEAFLVRFVRWLPDDAMRGEFVALFEQGISEAEREARVKTFMPKLQAHKKACPPPWHTEMTQTAEERAA